MIFESQTRKGLNLVIDSLKKRSHSGSEFIQVRDIIEVLRSIEEVSHKEELEINQKYGKILKTLDSLDFRNSLNSIFEKGRY